VPGYIAPAIIMATRSLRMLDRMAIALPLALTASGAIGQAADALAVAPNRSSAAKPMLIVALGDCTPVGPVTLGFVTTTENSRSVWLSFGRPVEDGTIWSRGIFR
jgi:hypothetical protein